MLFLMSQNCKAHNTVCLLVAGTGAAARATFMTSLLRQQVSICEGSITLTEQRALGFLASLTKGPDWSQPGCADPKKLCLAVSSQEVKECRPCLIRGQKDQTVIPPAAHPHQGAL